jgi:hypothetical protein
LVEESRAIPVAATLEHLSELWDPERRCTTSTEEEEEDGRTPVLSLTYSLTEALTYSLAEALTELLTYSLTYSLAEALELVSSWNFHTHRPSPWHESH